MKKTIFFSFLFLFIAFAVGARELKVESFEAMPTDITARTNAVNDLNGNKCALIKVALPVAGCDFKGNVLKQEFQVNEYYVYMSGGTKDLQVRCPGVESLMVDFRPYTDGKGLESGMTYYLRLSGYEDPSTGNPSVPALEPIYANLDVAYEPYGATIIIDGKSVGTTPDVVRDILVGPHSVSITMEGYEPYSGTVNIQEGQAARLAGTLKKEDKINGHEFVDLGLSVKWATCNVGASKPSDYGNYYAWGETKPKSSYTESNSVTYGKSMKDIGGTKHDVAHTEWGSRWRMPTEDEFYELIDKCKWVWTSVDGHAGYKVTGPNGNSIFLPAAGRRDGYSADYVGDSGEYWSSKPDSGDRSVWSLDFEDYHQDVSWSLLYHGISVRPVAE